MKAIHAKSVNSSFVLSVILFPLFCLKDHLSCYCSEWVATGLVFLPAISKDLIAIFLISWIVYLKHYGTAEDDQHVVSV